MRRRITWIAPYPKSGSTLVRALLLNYLAPNGATVPLNHLKAIPIAASRQLLNPALGCDSDLLLAREIPGLQDTWYDLVAHRQPGQFFTIHEQDDPRLHTPANSSLVLYIVRNPWDVAVSYAAHRGRSVADTIPVLEDQNYVASRSPTQRGHQLPQFYGSWSTHASSWLDQSAIPVHVTRNEAPLTNPCPTFAGLLQACGYSIDTNRLRAAVEAWSFQNLRAQEQADSIAQSHAKAIARFGYAQ